MVGVLLDESHWVFQKHVRVVFTLPSARGAPERYLTTNLQRHADEVALVHQSSECLKSFIFRLARFDYSLAP